MKMKIDKTSLNRVNKKVRKYKTLADKGVDREVKKTAAFAVRRAARRVVVDDDALRSSINFEPAGKGEVAVFAGVKYAPYVEFGTGRRVSLVELDKLGIPRNYAMRFKGQGIREVNLGSRPFFFNSIREEFVEMVRRIKNKVK